MKKYYNSFERDFKLDRISDVYRKLEPGKALLILNLTDQSQAIGVVLVDIEAVHVNAMHEIEHAKAVNWRWVEVWTCQNGIVAELERCTRLHVRVNSVFSACCHVN
jgi:hypothetical protein